jgi:signal transduction histidine kinase/CheY-like chemotaxis protein
LRFLLLMSPALAAVAVMAMDLVVGLPHEVCTVLLLTLALAQAAVTSVAVRRWQERDIAAATAARLADEAATTRERLMRQQAEMLAVAAHEIRTPLGGVLGLLDLLLSSSGLNRAARADAAVARQAAADLMLLLRDLIEVPGGGAAAPASEPFRIDEVMEQVVALLRARAAERGTRLATAVALGTAPTWRGDSTRIRQVLTNLAANAIRATEGGEVRLEARETPQGALELNVSDTGAGIAADRLSRMFERFQPSEGGAGLGLSICRDIAGRMGGSISVTSAPGRGSAFTVMLPLPRIETPDLPGVLPAPLVPPPHAEHGAAPQPGQIVLVVDDVAVNRRLLGMLLARAGYGHEGAGGGEQALAMLRARPYAAVLMDVQMPGLDGFETTRLIRALPGPTGRLPVLAVTAQDQDGARATAAAAGMNGYLIKPVSLDDLSAALASALAAKAG